MLASNQRLARNWVRIAKQAHFLRGEIEKLDESTPPSTRKQARYNKTTMKISDAVKRNAVETFHALSPKTANEILAIEHHLQTKPAGFVVWAVEAMHHPELVQKARKNAIAGLTHVENYSAMYASRLKNRSEKTVFRPTTLLENAAKMIDDFRRVKVRIHGENAFVESGAPELYAAVHELMENAVKAVSDKHGVSIPSQLKGRGKIEASVEKTRDGVLIKVEDDGVGFRNESDLLKGSSWRIPAVDSSGFGYDELVRKNLAQIGATLKAEGTPGVGAKFTIFVPYKPPKQPKKTTA